MIELQILLNFVSLFEIKNNYKRKIHISLGELAF